MNSEKINKRDGLFKSLIVKKVIRLILQGLYKSIELGHYSCSGYLIKVSTSHFITRNYLDSLEEFIVNVLERQTFNFDLGHYHYSFNSYSKVHCIQKLVLLVSFQYFYRGKSNEAQIDRLKLLIQHVFLDNVEDFTYMLDKIEAASKSYGMNSVCDKNTQQLMKKVLKQELANV
jgi:hypothetical protein